MNVNGANILHMPKSIAELHELSGSVLRRGQIASPVVDFTP